MDPPQEPDNVLQRRKKCTNVVIGLIFLFSGIEYAVILPTVWMYLQSLDAQPFFLGLVLSAFSLTEFLSGPVFGHWSDRTGKTKHVILLSNCFEIAGNFMYFVGISKWFLLASRLVAGVGAGAGASIFGYLTRHSSSKERAPVFAMAMACRQGGLLIGPAFNIFLRYCTFQLGSFRIDKFSAPGIFMCVLWTLLQLMVVLMFYDIPWNAVQSPSQEHQEHEPLLKETDVPSPLYGSISCTEELSSSRDDASVVEKEANTSATLMAHDPLQSRNDQLDGRLHNVTPVLGSYGFLLAEFVVGVFLQVLGLPFVSVSQVSLFSKVTTEKAQGFSHGIRRSVGGIATILGPLWAAGLTNNLYIMLGVMMGLLLLISIMVILSYKYLVDPAPTETETS